MATPIQFPDAFNGMYQDLPRDRLPKGKAWNMVDYIPNVLGAPAVQRGGWGQGASFSLTTGGQGGDGTATSLQAIAYIPFAVSGTANVGGAQVFGVTNNANLVQIKHVFSSTAIPSVIKITTLGSVGLILQAPILLQQTLFVPSADGSTSPNVFANAATSITSLTAGPAATYATVYSNRIAAAGTTAQPQRVYFSGIGDATSWNLTTSYIDVSGTVTGFAALPNVLLVFMADHCSRIRGTTPPPQTDMSQDDPIFAYGCSDARSIAVNGSFAAFANPQGVFLTNGTAFPTDLTLLCGIKQYWRTMMQAATSSWTLAGGWFGNYYIISVMNGSTFVDSLIFDVQAGATHHSVVCRLANIKAKMFSPVATSTAAGAGLSSAELVWARTDNASSGLASTMLTPGATNKADADGTAVTPVWESPFWDSKDTSSQRWKHVYLDYDLRDAATDNPTTTLSYVTSPESTSYTTVSQGALAKTTTRTFARRQLNVHSRGLGFKLVRANAAAFSRIYAIAATVYNREGSRTDSLV